MANTKTLSKEIMEEDDEHYVDAEEKGFLPEEHRIATLPVDRSSLSPRFWLSAGVNSAATAVIIFVNKRIFETQSLRHAQVTFAAFHFTVTAALLFLISRPSIGIFASKRIDVLRIVPLALGMIFNVVLPNASLAYSSIQFYQIMRVLVTPCVCVLNFVLLRQTTPRLAAATLVPVCIGVGFMSYFDTVPKGATKARGTTPLGVVFALAGVLATALYTVWVKKYHALLDCTSMQLLLNQAPISVLAMLYIIPFSDDVTVWHDVSWSTVLLIMLSGGLACLITVSQFVIIHEAGPVSSTVVGHFKTCLVILMSWLFGRKSFGGGSIIGVGLALVGIISYSAVMHKFSSRR